MSGSDYNYGISPADRIIKYPLDKRTFQPATNLLDGGSTLLLSDGTGSATNDRLLFLTNSTIEVYRNDPDSFRSVYVASLPLEPGRVPWYIASSSLHDSGIFYVVYRGDRGYTDYLYESAEFLEPRYVNVPVDAISATLDDNDVISFIGENEDTLEMQTTEQSSHSIIPADRIADCTSLRTLYPLDPIEEHRVYFSVTCVTSEGTTRHYSVEYLYQTSPLNLTASPLASGIPASWKQYLAVYDGADLTLYNRRNLDSDVPGHHRFDSRVRHVVFAEVAGRTWLTVQSDGENTFVVDVSLFIASSQGSQGSGVYELENTEIDCFPSCLPLVSTKTELIVVSVNVELSYSCVVFGLSTGVPVEIRRIENLPERPFGVVFVPDPTYQPSLPTSPPPTVQPPAFDNLPVILGPLGGFLLIVIIVGTVLPFVYMRIQNKNRRNRSSNLSAAAVHGVATISTAIQPEQTGPVGTSPPLELVPIPTIRPDILPLPKNVKETDIDDPKTPLLGPDSYSESMEGDSSAPIEGDPSAPKEGDPPVADPPAPIEGDPPVADPPAPIEGDPPALPLVDPQEESRECRPVEATERQGPSGIQVTSTGAKEPSKYNVTPTANPAKK